jgi:MarR family transcriptional regulator, lower aerobic nicotinate degradation pathway regulator
VKYIQLYDAQTEPREEDCVMTTETPAQPLVAEPLIGQLNHEITRHARLLHVLKSTMATLVPEGLDAAAFGLLITLVNGGPRRQGELAETCMLDPSTVSRHVGQLARAGYVERRPAPGDGRAVHLLATDEGAHVAHEIAQIRQKLISAALTDWADDDVARLVVLLRRLNDDLDAFRPHILATITDSPATEPAPDRQGTSDPRTPDLEIA